MAKYKPWLKMWVEWIDDPKMRAGTGGLTLAEQAVWWRLCTVAQKCAAEGPIIKDSGEPYTIDEIVDMLRLKESEQPIFDSMLEKMEKEKSIHWVDDVLVVTNLRKRQTVAPSETPEAVRDRVRRYRQNQKKKVSPDPSKKKGTLEEELESESELEGNGDVTGKKPLHPPVIVPYEQIFDLFHQNCPSLPRVKQITEKRKKALKKVFCNGPKSLQSVTNPLHIFEELFSKAEASDFLSGRKILEGEHSNWRCNIDWLLEERNMIKVLEGNYDNSEGGRHGRGIPGNQPAGAFADIEA